MKSERKGSAAKAELGAVVFVDAPTEWARLVDRGLTGFPITKRTRFTS